MDNKAIKDGNLNASYDVLLFPDVNKDIIVDGKPKREPGQMQYFEELPPEYSGGIGKEGVANLKKFVENGGTIIALASSGDLLAEEFNIPLRNALGRTRSEEFSSPGSLLRVYLDTSNPVAYGMPKEIAAFVNEPIAYQTVSPSPDIERSVLAWYPKDSEDILLSGWIRGPEMLERKAAAVTLQQGKGKLVLFAFRVQNRAQTEGTFKLLFNAIQWAGME